MLCCASAHEAKLTRRWWPKPCHKPTLPHSYTLISQTRDNVTLLSTAQHRPHSCTTMHLRPSMPSGAEDCHMLHCPHSHCGSTHTASTAAAAPLHQPTDTPPRLQPFKPPSFSSLSNRCNPATCTHDTHAAPATPVHAPTATRAGRVVSCTCAHHTHTSNTRTGTVNMTIVQHTTSCTCIRIPACNSQESCVTSPAAQKHHASEGSHPASSTKPSPW